MVQTGPASAQPAGPLSSRLAQWVVVVAIVAALLFAAAGWFSARRAACFSKATLLAQADGRVEFTARSRGGTPSTGGTGPGSATVVGGGYKGDQRLSVSIKCP